MTTASQTAAPPTDRPPLPPTARRWDDDDDPSAEADPMALQMAHRLAETRKKYSQRMIEIRQDAEEDGNTVNEDSYLRLLATMSELSPADPGSPYCKNNGNLRNQWLAENGSKMSVTFLPDGTMKCVALLKSEGKTKSIEGSARNASELKEFMQSNRFGHLV